MSESKEAGKETKAIIPIGSRGIELHSFDELYRFSKFIIEAGLAPRSIDTPEKVFLAIQYSMEMGFTPMVGLQNCMVINNRVAFFGELVAAQIEAHPEFEDMMVEYSGESGPSLTCTVTILRKGRAPSVGTFSIKEATHLINDPAKAGTWGRYPRRMLFWRAFSRAKVIFSDALIGITMQSDAEDEAPQQANVLSVTKPKFENENNQSRETVDTAQGNEQPNGGSGGSTEPAAEMAGKEDAQGSAPDEGGLQSGSEGNVPGDRESGSEEVEPEPVKKSAITKADRLLRLINADGFTQAQVIDLLSAFGAEVGKGDKSGLVHDLPETTLNAALQQWETVKFNLAK